MSKKNTFYLMIAAFVVSFCFLIVEAGNMYLISTGEMVTGKVTNFSSGRQSTTVTVQYTVDKQIYTEEIMISAMYSVRVGDEITLYYSANNPARVSTGSPNWIFVFVFGVIFVYSIVFMIKNKGAFKE